MKALVNKLPVALIVLVAVIIIPVLYGERLILQAIVDKPVCVVQPQAVVTATPSPEVTPTVTVKKVTPKVSTQSAQ